MKKIVALLLAVVMVACLFAGCKPSDDKATEPATKPSTTPTDKPTEPVTTPSQPSDPVNTAVIKKVALVTDVGTIDDESFNQACWEGTKAWCDQNNIEYTYYQPTEDSTDARVLSIGQAIQEGANVIVMPGFLFAGALMTVMDQYPDVYFLAVDVGEGDMTFDYETYQKPSANAVCMTFAEEQAGYLAGYAAVKDGYTKLGFLGGMAVPAVIRYGYGFIQGADAAANELGVDVQVNYTYGGQFAGSPEITAKMEGWYQGGTEVVFSCGGGIYSSAVEAANKHNGKVIGVDVDQAHIDPSIITSAMKGLANVTETALDDLNNGNWSNYGGKFLTFSLNEGDYIGLPTAADSWRLSTFTVEEYEKVKAEIMDGTRTIDNSSDENVMPTTSEHTTVTPIA